MREPRVAAGSGCHGVGFCIADHDHAQCVRQALDEAQQLCSERGVRLTPQRRRVLELVWRSERPMAAYALLEELRVDTPHAAAPVVYRALDFLIAQGFVHRIESQNSYAACHHPGEEHDGQFLLCTHCGRAVELGSRRISSQVRDDAEGLGFEVAQQTLEVHGLCPRCQGRCHE